MSDLSSEKTSSRMIPLRRALAGGLALLATGVTIGVLVGQMSEPSLASAPNPPPRKEAELTNTGGDAAQPLSRGQLSDLARGSQERDQSLQSTAPLEIGQPLQRTGPIGNQMASAGAMPLMREVGWADLNERVANVLNAGTPTRESLEQLVSLVNDAPPATPAPIVQTGGPGTLSVTTPLPPTVYDGNNSNKASPN